MILTFLLLARDPRRIGTLLGVALGRIADICAND